MLCPSFCELCPCPLATLVQIAKGNFPFLQVNTLCIVLGLLNGAATVVFWSASVSQLEVASCFIDLPHA